MPGGIFISYRRGDNRYAARSIYEALAKRFPSESIFMDVTGIEPGLDFEKVINERIGACEAMLVIIGRDWSSDPRLLDANDFVRLEIEAALQRDVRVIPVLIDELNALKEGELPATLKALCKRQAVRVSHTTFDADLQPLMAALEKMLQCPPGQHGRAAAVAPTRADEQTLVSGSHAGRRSGVWSKVLEWVLMSAVSIGLSYAMVSTLVNAETVKRGDPALALFLVSALLFFTRRPWACEAGAQIVSLCDGVRDCGSETVP